MRVRLKGINSRTKRLASGAVKTYWYAWKGGPPLPGKPGDPEFIAAYNAAVAQKIEAPKGVLSEVLDKFQDSGEFLYKISERTRYDYIRQIKRIEDAFADFPIEALDERKAPAVFLEWRDRLAKTSLRQADYAYSTLAHILKWAKKRGDVGTNPCAAGGTLYQGSRVDKVWPDEKIAAFLNVASPEMHRAMLLALETGQRQGDIFHCGDVGIFTVLTFPVDIGNAARIGSGAPPRIAVFWAPRPCGFFFLVARAVIDGLDDGDFTNGRIDLYFIRDECRHPPILFHITFKTIV